MGGSVIYIKSLNYVLVFYSLSFVSIKQVFKCSYSLIRGFIAKFEGKVLKNSHQEQNIGSMRLNSVFVKKPKEMFKNPFK